MIHELVFTSAPEGLKPGSQGFCTVAQSLGIPSNLALRLETFSAYRHLFQSPSPNAGNNPTMCMHLVVNLGGKRYHVLSRVADAGLDYTQRTNKIGHHFLFEDAECPDIGPAALFSIPNLFLTAWKQKPGLLKARTAFPALDVPPLSGAWERLGNERGWANVLAETVLTEQPVNLLFEPGTDVLPLFAEAIARLPVDLRWRATFSSYYNKLPPGVACQWKGIVHGTPEAATAAAGDALVLDLSQPLGKAPPVRRTFENRKSPPPPAPTASSSVPTSGFTPEVVFEPNLDGIYELGETVDLPTRSSFDAPRFKRSPHQPPPFWSSPIIFGSLLLAAFVLGSGFGAWWFRPVPAPEPPAPASSFLLDCIDLLLPENNSRNGGGTPP